jgi:hypothetical protein
MRRLRIGCCIGLLACLLTPSTAWGATSTSLGPPRPPTSSSLVVSQGHVAQASGPPVGVVAASNAVVGNCIWKIPGARCTVNFRVDAGPFSMQFTYFQAGVHRSLPRAYFYCLDPVCVVAQSGGGGSPPATPEAWIVNGNNAIILRMTI